MKKQNKDIIDIIPINKRKDILAMKVGGMILMCKHASNIEVLNKDNGEYYNVAIPGQRGGIAEGNVKPRAFDIADNPHGKTKEDAIKSGYLAIIKEKINNDLEVYRKLLECMGINEHKITLEDVSEYLKTEEHIDLEVYKKILGTIKITKCDGISKKKLKNILNKNINKEN